MPKKKVELDFNFNVEDEIDFAIQDCVNRSMRAESKEKTNVYKKLPKIYQERGRNIDLRASVAVQTSLRNNYFMEWTKEGLELLQNRVRSESLCEGEKTDLREFGLKGVVKDYLERKSALYETPVLCFCSGEKDAALNHREWIVDRFFETHEGEIRNFYEELLDEEREREEDLGKMYC